MKKEEVPQDSISTYANNKKAIYAQNEDGSLGIVPSSGWEVEELATKLALEEYEQNAKEAYFAVAKGEKSPLYYYMYQNRMDLQILSESTGFFKWSIKRDFDPKKFAKIKQKRLQIYAEALGVDADMLTTLPKGLYE